MASSASDPRMDEFTALALDEPGGELFAAMAFLAALAYPESTAKRDRAIEAMKSLMLRAARTYGRDYGTPPMLAQQQHGTLRRLAVRVGKRLDAAEAAAMFSLGLRQAGRKVKISPADQQRARSFVRRAGGRVAASPDDARKNGGVVVATQRRERGAVASVNYWAKRHSMRGDWERDTWRPSRPVLHLALGLRRVRMDWTDPRGFGLFPLLANPQWVRVALGSAERHVVLLEHAGEKYATLAAYRDCTRLRLIPA